MLVVVAASSSFKLSHVGVSVLGQGPVQRGGSKRIGGVPWRSGSMKQSQARIQRTVVSFAACAALLSAWLVRPAGGVVCEGDCSGNGAVSIDELVIMVNVALGELPMAACAI